MRRLRSEHGSALVISVCVMALMTSVSAVALTGAIGQQTRSGAERSSETAFQLAEATLNTELSIVAARWPASVATAHPVVCSNTVADQRCPNPTVLLRRFTGGSLAAGATWRLSVRDDLGASANHYSTSVADATPCLGGGAAPCTWDSNANGVMWIRAEAVVAGRKRVVVTQVRQLQTRLPFPRNVISADRFSTTNNGRKTIVDGKGCLAKHRPAAGCNATEPAPIAVRCSSAGAGTPGDACLGYRSDQVSPNLTIQSYASPILPPGGLQQLRTAAIQANRYFTSCPSLGQLAGPIVFIEGASCSYTGTGAINSGPVPGVLVVNQGTLTLGGTLDFYGVIYMANNLGAPQNSAVLLSLQGDAQVQGALFVEGAGAITAGSSGLNVSFDPTALANVLVPAGGVAQVPNSFRELPVNG